MTDEQLNLMIEAAAKKGAKEALAEIGLTDEHAGDDIRELRSLLGTLREMKKTAVQTFAKWVTMGILALLTAGVVMNTGLAKKFGL